MTNPATNLLNPDKAFFTRGVIESSIHAPFLVSKNQVLTINTSSSCPLSTAAKTIDTLVQNFAAQKSMPVVDTHFLATSQLSSREFAVKTFTFNKNISGVQPTITEGETHKVYSKLSKAEVGGRTFSSSTGLPFISKFFLD